MNSDPVPPQVPVPSFDQSTPYASAGENSTPAPGVTAPPTYSDGSSAPPEHAYTPLLPDLSQYDLTVGEALDVFSAENRKSPSVRTLQRYCQEGRFDCFKLKTTRNGNPVHEWIINSTSLRAFIQTKPEEPTEGSLTTPVETGDAEPMTNAAKSIESSDNVTASPEQIDVAGAKPVLPRNPVERPDVMATQEAGDDATDGELSRVELMVENAKLTARLDAQDDLIGELREDKKFMREQITHQRGNDSLMADMHRETLHTLKAVSVAGRHTRIEMPDATPAEQGSTYYEARDSEQRPPIDGVDDV